MTKKLRFVTAASLFDGHDASINIMRRLLQAQGAEVIHLGHNRSAWDIVNAAIQEDAHAVAVSSYQGGHNEYFAYIRELLDKNNCQNVRIFGGGGGVITPSEIKALENKGITKIYSPEDGMKLGLTGIIEDMIKRAEHQTYDNINFQTFKNKKLNDWELAKIISKVEDTGEVPFEIEDKEIPILGVTGTGGAGKSSLIDELLLRFKRFYPNKRVALISIDPTRKKTGGALLGDRIRLGSASFDNFFIRSLATRGSGSELSPQIKSVAKFLKNQSFDLVIVETSGIGQANDAISQISNKTAYVMTPEYGAASQLEKIEMLDVADFIVLNKFEKARSEDALRDIRKQYRRNKNLFGNNNTDDSLPVYGTIASRFNDTGVNALFRDIAKSFIFSDVNLNCEKAPTKKNSIIAPERALYLRDIAQTCRQYNTKTKHQVELLRDYEALKRADKILQNDVLKTKLKDLEIEITPTVFETITKFDDVIKQYKAGEYSYNVRGKEIKVKTKYKSLSGNDISKVAFPNLNSLSEKYNFIRAQNLPGFYPYSSGIFPFKRSDEEPKRMFAGEGGPGKTNKRFHYLSKNDPAKRLSTAFDSVTLYGEDPALRPDIFGKIGESGVSIATLDDMQTLFEGFKLSDPSTSVSMTINGPAPMILALFMNTAMKQELNEKDFWDAKSSWNGSS
jgi:methylmalonyl-CoA mutase